MVSQNSLVGILLHIFEVNFLWFKTASPNWLWRPSVGSQSRPPILRFPPQFRNPLVCRLPPLCPAADSGSSQNRSKHTMIVFWFSLFLIHYWHHFCSISAIFAKRTICQVSEALLINSITASLFFVPDSFLSSKCCNFHFHCLTTC